MGSRRGQFALVAVVVATALAAAAARGAAVRVIVSHTPNVTQTNRTARTITGIVIHDTEGPFLGSIRTLQNPHVDGSAHFVVSRTGQIVQLVPVTDIAWHAGNGYWNLHSIGIEHVGYADRDDYTEAEYRASAQLVAYLAHRWGIPLDRRHIIGHDEVPDPNHPHRFGGIDHHTDPGRFWNWHLYMALVRHYAADPVRPQFILHAPLPGTRNRPRSLVSADALLRGRAAWSSSIDAARLWRRHIWKAEFIVDGRLLYTDHTWPFVFNQGRGWDSTTVADGRHLLSVRAFGAHGYRTRQRIPVRVDNPPLSVDIVGAASNSTVQGKLALAVSVDGPVERVTLTVDGVAVSRDSSPPYELSWDTTTASDGPHVATVFVRGLHGRRAQVSLQLIVANQPGLPSLLSRDWLNRDAFLN